MEFHESFYRQFPHSVSSMIWLLKGRKFSWNQYSWSHMSNQRHWNICSKHLTFNQNTETLKTSRQDICSKSTCYAHNENYITTNNNNNNNKWKSSTSPRRLYCYWIYSTFSRLLNFNSRLYPSLFGWSLPSGHMTAAK